MEPPPASSHVDPRVRHAVMSLLPLPLFTGAMFCVYWGYQRFWGVAGAVALVLAGLALTRLNRVNNARLYRQFLPPDFPGEAGVDFLMFESEPAESYQKFRVLAEDAGCIYPVGREFHIVTLRHRWAIPMDDLQYRAVKGGLGVWGVQISFTPAPVPLPVTFVAAFAYYGSEKGKSSGEPKAQWACEVLSGWRTAAAKAGVAQT